MSGWSHSLRAWLCRAERWFWLSGLGLLSGCSFGDDAQMSVQNSCVVDADCPSNRCEDGFCVMTGSKPLSVTLEVIPKRMPDGSQPIPIVGDSFALQGGRNTPFMLRLPITIPVRIGIAGNRLDAQFSFTPRLVSRLVGKSTQVTTLGSGSKSGPAEVQALLMAGVDYDVTVQPVDPNLSPHSFQFTATHETAIDIDYAEITFQARRFLIRNLPSEPLVLRARSKATGQLISNTVPLAGGTVSLKFEQDDETPYTLELAPMAAARPSAGNSQCDQAATLLPTLSIDVPTLLGEKPAPEVLSIDLPKLPASVQYSGSLQLCPAQTLSTPRPSFPMTLKASTVNLGAGANTAITATYETSTAAMWNDDSQQFEFCSRILPGDYVIVATPPTNVNCEIFAERRQLDEDDELAGGELQLRTPATLMGTVVTPDLMKMSNAAIELNALGSSNVTLAENDPTVPSYNRSRQSTSDANGSFKIMADVGTYDVVVKPPAQSNFAWRVIYGVDVASRRGFATQVGLNAPVAVMGALNYMTGTKSDQSTLGSAEIHAYTVVDEGKATARSIEIARSQADDKGNVMLLVTPDLQHSWTPL